MKHTCRTCPFAVRDAGYKPPYGACRRGPPTPYNPTESAFPVVHLDAMICGEHPHFMTTVTAAPDDKTATTETDTRTDLYD